ncbi:MAG: hypothetical protein ACI9JL_004117 [Paracoccaceae bacterium]|jgi:hypothetical protein
MRLLRGTVLAVTGLFLVTPASADTAWNPVQVDAASLPATIIPETRRPAPGGMPHALIATDPKRGDIGGAWYAGRTERYAHGILGDAIEASILRVATRGGRYLKLTLPKTEVFEDRYPRLADLDGDGTTEIVTIRSSVTHGASVTVYGVQDGKLVMRAATEFIGRANRWLNIAGIAPFRRGKGMEIAYVQTPHIGGTLFFYAYEAGKLVKVGERAGFSNHQIGSTEMRLSAIADIDGDGGGAPELALPSADRRDLRIVGFDKGRLIDRGAAPLPARIDKAIGIRGSGTAAQFIVGLENGEVYVVRR